MIVYLDTSVILRYLLGQQNAYRQWGEWSHAYTSELAFVEAARCIDRLRLQQKITDVEVAEKVQGLNKVKGYLGEIRLSRSVLKRAAEPHSTLISTLDALHLASATLWQQHRKKQLVFLTHDHQLAIAAQATGMTVAGV